MTHDAGPVGSPKGLHHRGDAARWLVGTLALLPTVLGFPGDAAGQTAEGPASVQVEFREVIGAIDLEPPAHGTFTLTMDASLGDQEVPDSIGISVGDLSVTVPLSDGRYRGAVDSGPGRVHAVARVRKGRARLWLRGALRSGEGGALGLRYLQGCADTYFWNGVVYGLHAVSVTIGSTEHRGVLGVAGRSEDIPRLYGNDIYVEGVDRYSVSIRGCAVFPGIDDQGSRVQLVPDGVGQLWRGRMRGQALGVGSAPVVTVSYGPGTARTLEPLDEEAIDLGDGERPAEGIGSLDVDGATVFQARFDCAVPGASEGRVARVEAGGTSVLRRRVRSPQPEPPVDLDMDGHVLEVRADGSVWAWGDNSYGQVGDGTTEYPPTRPSHVPLPVAARAIAAGWGVTLALDENGQVWQWGELIVYSRPSEFEFTVKSVRSLVPLRVDGLPAIKSISMGGGQHVLALDSVGRVWAWGSNDDGQLGDGTKVGRKVPKAVPGLRRIRQIAAGYEISLALDDEGRVWAWGRHDLSLDGDGTAPVQVEGLPPVRSIHAGGNGAVLAQDGTVWTWGLNRWGQLGDGTTTNRDVPVQVVGLARVADVAVGGFHSLALREDGTVWGWGLNDSGEVGDGSSVERHSAVRVRDLSDIVKVSAGAFFSTAVGADGSLWTWGSVEQAVGVVGWRRAYSGVHPCLLDRSGDVGHIYDYGPPQGGR